MLSMRNWVFMLLYAGVPVPFTLANVRLVRPVQLNVYLLGGPVAFSKYENDDVSQTESMDSLLRLVRRSEAPFWELVDEKGMSAELAPVNAADKAVPKMKMINVSTTNVISMAEFRDGGFRVAASRIYNYPAYPIEAKQWKM